VSSCPGVDRQGDHRPLLHPPYAVVRNLGSLFPRTPRVDARVLSLATQLAAALDEPVTVSELEALLPRTPLEVIDEGVLLLRLAGMVEVAPHEGTPTLLPTTRLRNTVTALPQSPAGVTRVSDLRRPPTPQQPSRAPDDIE
jgi:hypothetical protein